MFILLTVGRVCLHSDWGCMTGLLFWPMLAVFGMFKLCTQSFKSIAIVLYLVCYYC